MAVQSVDCYYLVNIIHSVVYRWSVQCTNFKWKANLFLSNNCIRVTFYCIRYLKSTYIKHKLQTFIWSYHINDTHVVLFEKSPHMYSFILLNHTYWIFRAVSLTRDSIWYMIILFMNINKEYFDALNWMHHYYCTCWIYWTKTFRNDSILNRKSWNITFYTLL